MARAIWSGSIGKQMAEEPQTREAKVFDLADALRRSVEAAKKGAKTKPAARAPARQARSRRRTRKVG